MNTVLGLKIAYVRSIIVATVACSTSVFGQVLDGEWLVGHWQGEVKEGSRTYQMTLSFAENESGSLVGKASYPSLCDSVLIVSKLEHDEVVVQETITKNQSRCIDGSIRISRLSDTKLSLSWNTRTTAILTKAGVNGVSVDQFSTTSSLISELIGNWIGVASEPDSSIEEYGFQLSLSTIDGADGVRGKSRYPAHECTGTLSFVSETNNSITLYERNSSGCGSGYVTLMPDHSERLQWLWRRSRTGRIIASGHLERSKEDDQEFVGGSEIANTIESQLDDDEVEFLRWLPSQRRLERQRVLKANLALGALRVVNPWKTSAGNQCEKSTWSVVERALGNKYLTDAFSKLTKGLILQSIDTGLSQWSGLGKYVVSISMKVGVSTLNDAAFGTLDLASLNAQTAKLITRETISFIFPRVAEYYSIDGVSSYLLERVSKEAAAKLLDELLPKERVKSFNAELESTKLDPNVKVKVRLLYNEETHYVLMFVRSGGDGCESDRIHVVRYQVNRHGNMKSHTKVYRNTVRLK